MLFIRHVPQYPLSLFIECLWYVRGHSPSVREKVLPMPTIELMINLGSPHKVVNQTDFGQYQLCKASWISGLHTEYIVTETVAETELAGVRFRPGGVYPFLSLPLAEVSNQVVDMELIWGRLIGEVQEQLWSLHEPADQLRRLEAILHTRLDPHACDHSWRAVQFALEQILPIEIALTVRTLSEQMGISQKHLIDLFHKFVGISPKQVQRITRFNHALRTINPAQPIDWTELAHACNYYDQAHFNKDFLAFSGLNPSNYLAQRSKWYGDNLRQGEDVHFVPLG